jgi:hypothetical protein
LYTLTSSDLTSCRKFEDVIAHGGYPIDIHSPDGEGTKTEHPNWRDTYGIPYRCLVNKKIGNLVTVGRCISATFEAQASIRVSPIAGATGHAGGAAASLAAERGTKPCNIDVKELQSILLKQGAYLITVYSMRTEPVGTGVGKNLIKLRRQDSTHLRHNPQRNLLPLTAILKVI